jgi:hypothetical protein
VRGHQHANQSSRFEKQLSHKKIVVLFMAKCKTSLPVNAEEGNKIIIKPVTIIN